MLFLLSFFLNLDAVPNVLAPGDDSLKFIKLSRLELERNDRTGYPTMPQLMFSVCFRSLLVWLIWSCRLKTIHRFRWLRKKFPRLERSFRWLLHLIRNSQLPRYVRSKVLGHKVAVLSLENSRRRFVFIPKFSGDLRNILEIKCEKLSLQNQIVGMLVDLPPNIVDE